MYEGRQRCNTLLVHCFSLVPASHPRDLSVYQIGARLGDVQVADVTVIRVVGGRVVHVVVCPHYVGELIMVSNELTCEKINAVT